MMTGEQMSLEHVDAFKRAVRSRKVSPQAVAGILILCHEGSAAFAIAALPVWFPEDAMMRAFIGDVRNELRAVLEADASVTVPLFRPALRVVNGGKR